MASMIQSVDESLARDWTPEARRVEARVTTPIFIFFSDNGGNSHSNTEKETAQKNRESKQGQMIARDSEESGTFNPSDEQHASA